MRYVTPADRTTKTPRDSAFDAWNGLLCKKREKDDKKEKLDPIIVYLQGLWPLFKPQLSNTHIVKITIENQDRTRASISEVQVLATKQTHTCTHRPSPDQPMHRAIS